MLMLPPGVRILIASQPADLRKSFDGLAALIRDVLKHDPLSEQLFVFFNRTGHRVKILFWHRTGYVLWYKRLQSGLFHPPAGDEASIEVRPEQLALLLDGVDLAGARRRKSF
jgi:transposase